MNSRRSIPGSSKARLARVGSVALLSSCLFLAVPSTALAKTKPAPKHPAPTSSPWAAVLKGLATSENATFSASYKLLETKNGVTTTNELITYAQDPSAKEVTLITPKASFYIEGPKTVV